MTVAAIIPARGGSKGIANKNIYPIQGRPLIGWSITQALNSNSIDTVYVTSDSPKILEISEFFGAIPILRPPEISDDAATSESAWLHAITELALTQSEPDLVVGIQATSPLRHSTDFDTAIKLYYEDELDTLFSSNLIEDFHVWEGLGTKSLKANYDYHNRQRRQNIEARYLENGSFYLFTPDGIKKHNNRLHGKIGTYIQEKYKSAQIDEPIDIQICSALLGEFIS